jgi:photosystem II stability/assembly factor-like uncharacterized protein
MDALKPGGLSRRKWRAVAWGTAAAIVMIVAAVVYLRPSLPATTPSAGTLTATNPTEATNVYAVYDFPSPSVGWALAFPMNFQGRFWVSRTLDGGKHWQNRLKGDNAMSGSTPVGVRFFDEKRGFISTGVSGELLHTIDGGAHWQSLRLPPEQRITYLGFRDERHGWLISPILVGPPAGGSGNLPDELPGQPSHLYATEDAGASWQRLPDAPAGAWSFAFRGALEAWLGGVSSGKPGVYRSVDGGLTWQRREIPYPDGDTSMSNIGAWNTFLTLLPGAGVVASTFCSCPANASFQSTSFDGGATWRFVPVAPFSSARRAFVAYQDDTHWWYVDAGALYRSSDAGQTWTKVADQLPAGEFMPKAIDMKHAWAQVRGSGGYGLATTADAGLHWTRVRIPQPT